MTTSIAAPFPGLRPFVKADAPWFFGRNEQIEALHGCLDRHDLIAVVGGSGVGKSSLVYAGLLPQLEQEAAWRFVDMRPRGAPRIALAKAFIQMLTESHPITPEEVDSSALVDHVRATLARSAFGLVDLTREWLPEDGKQLLVLVDQFEEIFRYEPKNSAGAISAIEDEAAAFVALLLTAASADSVPVRVMLTMRADYIGDCIRFEGLPEAISEGQYLVPRLIREQIEAVIREPVIRAGATIDHDLVEQLLNDSAKESDALPVLQHVLMRLWEKAGKQDGMAGSGVRRRLTMDLYESKPIGRMSKALSRHADSVMEELTRSKLGSRAELIVEQVMRALIEVDRQGRAIRRPIPFDQLVRETGFGQPEIKQVIEAMRAEPCCFLRPGPQDNLEKDTVIDVGHEALMRCWQRMADPENPQKSWLVKESTSDLWWRSLLIQAKDFEGDASNVLPPAMTEERADWLKSRNPVWAERYGGGWERVQALITASQEATARQRKREQSYIWRLQLSVIVLIVLTICLIVLAFRLDSTERDAQTVTDTLLEDNINLAKDLKQSSPEVAKAIEHITNEAGDSNTKNRPEIVLLEFDPDSNKLGKQKKLSDGLSAVVQIGDTLWVANDEALSLERLSRRRGNGDGAIRYADHRQFPLHDFLQLPMPPAADGKIEEADIEGLDYQNGYLWLVGSHSLKRGKPDEEDSIEKNTKRLVKVSRAGNRFLLARIPLVEATQSLERTVEQNGNTRTAARLRGDAVGNALTEALATDPHLGPFLAIPGKDNGFDIEGLAVAGDRVFVGLRGPVLRGWAVILELALEQQDASTLTLKPIGPEGQPYRKHVLNLGGLGVRDLCVQGDDLLVLAGPTMTVAGPQKVFRWPGGARPDRESQVFFGEALPKFRKLPFGIRQKQGKDQAEGITLFAPDGGEARQVLVVYDSTAPGRQRGTSAVEADLFALP